METSQSEAISACQKGELEKFSVLYEKYVDKIYSFIYYKTMHTETAEDLTSQTFMKALEKIGTYDNNKSSFTTWLYQIARNTTIDYYRRLHPEEDLVDVWHLGDKTDLAVDIDNRELLVKVQKYIHQLQPEQREVVLLRLWDNLPYQEIAKLVGKTEASCKMMFSRALIKMQQEITLVLLALIINYL
jgi:RNA polymerase sigma-70 factor (ECF subfamily)